MTITTVYDQNSNLLTINLPKQFVFNSYKAFREAYETTAPDTKTVKLNFQHTEYLDSAALGMLMLLHDHCNNAKRTMELSNYSEYVKKLITTTQLDKYFTLG